MGNATSEQDLKQMYDNWMNGKEKNAIRDRIRDAEDYYDAVANEYDNLQGKINEVNDALNDVRRELLEIERKLKQRPSQSEHKHAVELRVLLKHGQAVYDDISEFMDHELKVPKVNERVMSDEPMLGARKSRKGKHGRKPSTNRNPKRKSSCKKRHMKWVVNGKGRKSYCKKNNNSPLKKGGKM